MSFTEGDTRILKRSAEALEKNNELMGTLYELHDRVQKSHEAEYAANQEIRERDKRNLDLSYEIMQRNLAAAERSEARWKAIDEATAAPRKDGK